MIKYHGGPITPEVAAIEAWRDGHAMISFANQQQIETAFEYAASVALDNGAYSLWGKGERVDVDAYRKFVEFWRRHPAFDWCVIPDIIDGDEQENNKLIEQWPLDNCISVPVWHLNESLEKLGWLIDEFPRVALGSAGEFAEIGTDRWRARMGKAMEVACDADGFPKTPLHILRGMDNDITSNIPAKSVDSCYIARNSGMDKKWENNPFAPTSKRRRALWLRDRISHHAVCSRWTKDWGRNMELFG